MNSQSIYYENVLVTPEYAQTLLDNMGANRNLSISVVKRYARDMAAGKWELNGDTICLDGNGILTDGQHRLSALVLSGVSVWMTIVHNVPPSATKDIGRARNIADSLRIFNGYEDFGKAQLADLRMISAAAFGRCALTPSEIMILHARYKDELSCIYSCINHTLVFAPARAAALVAIKDMALPEKSVLRFLQVFQTGFSADRTENAALAYRNYIKKQRILGSGKERVTAFEYALGGIAAFCKGNTQEKLARPIRRDYSLLNGIVFGETH